MPAASPCNLILALDVETREEALALAKPLAGNLRWVKLGLQLFTRHGPGIVDDFRQALIALDADNV